VFEELPDRGSEARARPDVAEPAAKLAEAFDENRNIQGATKRTANECCRGFLRHVDGLIHRRDFGDRDTAVNCI
jgi:hypothetical protein